MATAKVLLNKNKNYKKESIDIAQESYPLVIRISHLSKNKFIETGYELKTKEWNEDAGKIRSSYPNSGRANAKVSSMLTKALDVIALPKANLKKMNVHQLVQLIESRMNESFETDLKNDNLEQLVGTRFTDYSDKVEQRYRLAGRFGSADSVKNAKSATLRFCKNPDLLLSEITETFLDDFEAWWKGQGNKTNGLGAVLRMVRRVFNLAIKDKSTELTVEHYPFGLHGYSIKKGKTSKRAIKEIAMDKIRAQEFKPYSKIWHDKNYFLFCFNLHGMNFADLIKLTMSNLVKDEKGEFERLIYRRLKTQRGENVKTFNIKLTEEAKTILKLYTPNKKSEDLIFPVLEKVIHTRSEEEIHKYAKRKLGFHNKGLKIIAKHVGLEDNLTTYVARHTFATLGLYKGVSKTEIGAMMGHTSAVTTEVYLDEFEHDVLDNAADVIFS